MSFERLLKVDIPKIWTEHHDQQSEMLAKKSGLPLSEMEVFICLVAPECHESLCYQKWLHSLPMSEAILCTPICIVCAATFDTDFGIGATDRFWISMRARGRPHHFQRIGCPKANIRPM